MDRLDTRLKELQLGNIGRNALDDAINDINGLKVEEISTNRIKVAQLFVETLRQAQAFFSPDDADISRRLFCTLGR